MGRDYLKDILKYSITSGFVTAVIALSIGLFAMIYLNADESLYQTYILSIICIMGIFNFLYIYTWPAKARNLFEPKAIVTGIISLLFLPAAMYLFDLISDFFVIKDIGIIDWLIVLAFAMLGIVSTYLICRYDLIFKLYVPSEKSS